MVATPALPTVETAPPKSARLSSDSTCSLSTWLLDPPQQTEWIEGQIIEKNAMGAKHSRIQARLARYWGNHLESSGQGGEVYTEAPCRTQAHGRRPDVAYLTSELVAQFGDFTVLLQSFTLIAEIISPSDRAEAIFTKVKEYLTSGCEEVWLIFPESRWAI
ncbi:MAG: Uma2 family endonuclease [Spirulinaceae cyanobacterium]